MRVAAPRDDSNRPWLDVASNIRNNYTPVAL